MPKNHTEEGEELAEGRKILQTSLHVRYNSWWLFPENFFSPFFVVRRKTKFSGCPIFLRHDHERKRRKLSIKKWNLCFSLPMLACLLFRLVILHQISSLKCCSHTHSSRLKWRWWRRKFCAFHKESECGGEEKLKVHLKDHRRGGFASDGESKEMFAKEHRFTAKTRFESHVTYEPAYPRDPSSRFTFSLFTFFSTRLEIEFLWINLNGYWTWIGGDFYD